MTFIDNNTMSHDINCGASAIATPLVDFHRRLAVSSSYLETCAARHTQKNAACKIDLHTAILYDSIRF